MKFLIIGDHKIIRDGLKQIIWKHFPMATCDEVNNAGDALSLVNGSDYNVVIYDLSVSGRSGLDVIGRISDTHPRLPLLILSMHSEEHDAIRALRAGAWGYLRKTDGADVLISAIERVMQGRKYIPFQVAEQLTDRSNAPYARLHDSLSDREFHVFKLIAEGRSISEISTLLSLGPSTVSTHRSRILRKLQMKTNADLTKYALQQNLLQ